MASSHNFAVCVQNEGYEVSLELRKIYEVLDDDGARCQGQLRVIDESGEDYLYPVDFFVLIDLPDAVEAKLIDAA